MGIKGWQNPISCEDVPAMDNIVAREGKKRKFLRAEDCAYWHGSQR